MSERAAYSRVYWSIVDDLKFHDIYDDDRHLAVWLRLLLIADQAHPASANVPAGTRRASVAALAEAGLIDLGTGSRYRIHGLDAERERRRIAATTRGPKGDRTVPERDPDGIQTPGLRRDETRRDEERQDETVTPLPPASGGTGLRADGDSRRQRAEAARAEEREQRRQESMALQQRYLKGELTTDEYEALKADIGKNPDDLTRLSVVRQ